MTPTLEKAIDLAHTLSVDDQERAGQEFLAILEKHQIVRDLDERDAEGGAILVNEASDRLISEIKARNGL